MSKGLVQRGTAVIYLMNVKIVLRAADVLTDGDSGRRLSYVYVLSATENY